MDEEIKNIAYNVVNRIYKKIKKIQQLEYQKFGVNIGIGADGTPTKYIDKIAEDIAINFIKKSKIKINILSEEAGFLDLNGEYTFILDPIDGTRNAVRGIPIYSISLGVGKKSMDDIDFGIVKNIPSGDLFIAERGNGAFFNNKRIFTPEMPDNEVIISFNNCSAIQNSDYKFNKLRSLGCASLEMCMVASGAIDIYTVSEEYIRVTDIAASSLILLESGGFLTNIEGKKVNLDLNLDGRTSIIAACNKDLINDFITRCKNLK
jgi:fructose-1,6-bisphosphatase/inositol monophosphatase family enzyme